MQTNQFNSSFAFLIELNVIAKGHLFGSFIVFCFLSIHSQSPPRSHNPICALVYCYLVDPDMDGCSTWNSAEFSSDLDTATASYSSLLDC